MFRQIRRFASCKILLHSTKWSNIKTRNCIKLVDTGIRKWYFSITGGLFGLAHIEAQNSSDEYTEDLKRASTEGVKYLALMMRVLRTLILQTSIEYQECLIKQIELTKQNTLIGPIGEHWDKLTVFRVQGKNLKDELFKYEALAASLADIVSHEIEATDDISSNMIMELLHGELGKLQRLCNEQLKEVHRCETELLAANRDSILQGAKSK